MWFSDWVTREFGGYDNSRKVESSVEVCVCHSDEKVLGEDKD